MPKEEPERERERESRYFHLVHKDNVSVTRVRKRANQLFSLSFSFQLSFLQNALVHMHHRAHPAHLYSRAQGVHTVRALYIYTGNAERAA